MNPSGWILHPSSVKCVFKSNHNLLFPLESTSRTCPHRALWQSRVMEEAHGSAHLSIHRHAPPPARFGNAAGPRGQRAGGLAALGLTIAHLFPASGLSPCTGDGGKPGSQKKGQLWGNAPSIPTQKQDFGVFWKTISVEQHLGAWSSTINLQRGKATQGKLVRRSWSRETLAEGVLKSRARFSIEVEDFPPPCRLLARGAHSLLVC